MSSWAPVDLVSDADLVTYEGSILKQFGQASWEDKRRAAIGHWLFPLLKGRGYDPFRLITRAEASVVYGYTGSAYSDMTSTCRDTTADDVNLATIFATAGSDALYVGSTEPFRGLYVAQDDSVSSASSVLSVAYWNGAWTNLGVSDGTRHTSGKTFSGGGSVPWSLPVDWMRRAVNSSARIYWVKLTVSATPTSAKARQIGMIRQSALSAPATLRTLELIFREAPTGQDGPWEEKASYYKGEAEAALDRAWAYLSQEFDSDNSDQVSDTEHQQTADQVSNGWSLERA